MNNPLSPSPSPHPQCQNTSPPNKCTQNLKTLIRKRKKTPLRPPSNPDQMYTLSEAKKLIRQSSSLLSSSNALLSEARTIANRNGLTVDSKIIDASYQSPFLPKPYFRSSKNNNHNGDHTNNNNTNIISSNSNSQHDNSKESSSSTPIILNAFPPILSTTGGHSNIDHIIQYTGNYYQDTVAEYKRKLKRRIKAQTPEHKGTDRWDQPRISGSRRRRILRERDLPCAPPEPPPSGYVIYIAQMTTKIRHDRPHVHHNQVQVVREISKIWKYGMSDSDRDYYNVFCTETREEYEKQHAEFKATGSYKPSKVFERLHGDGPWVRIAYHEKNALEREISGYDSVKFPPRPLEMEKPDWVRVREKAKEKEMERRKAREERAKKRREKERKALEEASKEKEKRLRAIDEH